MPKTRRRAVPTGGELGRVPSDSLLGKVLQTLRDRGEVFPAYVDVLDKIAEYGDVAEAVEAALAGVDAGRKDEIGQELIHSVAIAALACTMASDLPRRRSNAQASFKKLLAALELLGAHFGVRKFPDVALPSDIPAVNDLDFDAELHRAVEARRVVLGLSASTLDDRRFQGQLAFARYKLDQAPAAILAMWECVKIEENATFASLKIPGFSRKQIKDANRLAFILELDQRMRSTLKRQHIGFLSAITNILFDVDGTGGFSEDAIRQYLKRSSVRGG